MLEQGLETAVNGFSGRDPVLGAVIILLLIANALVFKIMNDFRKEAVERALRAEDKLDRHLAEQRDDFRNMGEVTKTIEGMAVKMSDMQRATQEMASAVMRSKS